MRVFVLEIVLPVANIDEYKRYDMKKRIEYSFIEPSKEDNLFSITRESLNITWIHEEYSRSDNAYIQR